MPMLMGRDKYIYIFELKDGSPRMITKDKIADNIKGCYFDDAGEPFDSEDVNKVSCYYYPAPRLITLDQFQPPGGY